MNAGNFPVADELLSIGGDLGAFFCVGAGGVKAWVFGWNSKRFGLARNWRALGFFTVCN